MVLHNPHVAANVADTLIEARDRITFCKIVVGIDSFDPDRAATERILSLEPVVTQDYMLSVWMADDIHRAIAGNRAALDVSGEPHVLDVAVRGCESVRTRIVNVYAARKLRRWTERGYSSGEDSEAAQGPEARPVDSDHSASSPVASKNARATSSIRTVAIAFNQKRCLPLDDDLRIDSDLTTARDRHLPVTDGLENSIQRCA